MKILALDLGKRKTVACNYNSETGEYHFSSTKTLASALHDLIVEVQPDRVVLEIGPAAGWLSDMIKLLEIDVQVANTAHPSWRWTNTKRKNDRVDALRIARMSARNELPQVHVPAPEVRQWRSLIRYRHHLVRRRTQIKNRIRAILEREGRSMPAGKQAWTSASLLLLRELARPLDSVPIEEFWKGELHVELEALKTTGGFIQQVEHKLDEVASQQERCQLVQTIPGVGPRLAEIVVAMVDNPQRFPSAKELGSYVGLTPRQYQSGDSNRQGRISGQGNALLRALLVEVSWVALRHNSWLRSVYEQVMRGSPSRKKIAIVAAARRLLIRCWAMLRDGTRWRPTAPRGKPAVA